MKHEVIIINSSRTSRYVDRVKKKKKKKKRNLDKSRKGKIDADRKRVNIFAIAEISSE